MQDVRASPMTTLAPPVGLFLGGAAAPLRAGVRRASRFLVVFALFAAVTAVLFWQCLPHLGSALIGPPEDNMQDYWNSWYAATATHPDFFFTTLIRFPQGTWLHYHSFDYPQIALLILLTKIVGTSQASLVLLQNLTLLLTFPLSGAGAFYLARHFTRSDVAGAVGGFVFAFNPSHVAQALHHAHVASIEFLPVFVLCYLLALEKKSFGWLGGAILFWTLSALSCWYYLFYAGYFVIFHAVYLRVRDNKLPAGWRLFAPLAGAAGTALLLAPLIIPMMREASDPGIYGSGGNTFVADLAGYLAFPPAHLLGSWTRGLYASFTGNPWEATVYLGLVNVAALVFLWLRTRPAGDPVLRYVLWGMLVFCVLASGECLHVAGHVLTYLHLPDVVLSKLPFVANVRGPSRAIVMVYLFLGIGVGRAAALAWEDRHGPVLGGVLAAAAVLLLLDYYPADLPMTPVACPAGLAAIESDPEQGFGVLDLPGGYVEGNAAMLAQTCHGRPIAQGNVSRRVVATLADQLDIRDLDAQRRQLAAARIKYIVIARPRDGMFAWQAADGPRDLYPRRYPLVYDGPERTVLRVY
ncbi:MAG: hypothetical protein WDN08_13635 [Rhizomicrobium sp.]